MGTYVAKFLKVLNNRGFLLALWLVGKNLIYIFRERFFDRFDQEFGTNTRGTIQLADLDIVSKNLQYGVWYEPMCFRTLRYILHKLPSIVGIEYGDYSFVDFGSGKGRALLVASNFPFREIIGIEFSHDLCEIAQNNIAIYRSSEQQCQKITSLCVDAGEYKLTGKNLVCFFYNPFGESVVKQVIDNIKAFSDQTHGRVIVVYYNPHHARCFDECGLFGDRIAMNLPYDFEKIRQSRCILYCSL